MSHVDGQLDYLEYGKEKAWWHVGNEVKGEDFGVYGFKCPVHAAVLQDWSTRCGIDWSVTPDEQTVRPPQTSRPHRKDRGPPARTRTDNLHSLARTGRPLGVICKTCGHRALIPLDRLGAHSGNRQEIHTLKLKCSACESREWKPTLFQRAEDVDTFLQPAASVAA